MLESLGPEIFLMLPALLIALTFHEFAHALASDRLGDTTPRLRGRLTLNPLAHIDPIGLVMLFLFRFGWAKPVEVNPYNYDNRERGMALVALAGPAMNLFLGLVAVFLFYVVQMVQGYSALARLCRWLVIYNVYFAVFNLLPIPPLDGSKLLFFILPRRTVYRYLDAIAPYGFLILILAVSTGLVSNILRPIADSIWSSYDLLARSLLGF
ncbi:MAG: site-2 protease family protein [Firmicutes bacterium]|nr:site-2 protease family protein [Bacillota bacterium]